MTQSLTPHEDAANKAMAELKASLDFTDKNEKRGARNRFNYEMVNISSKEIAKLLDAGLSPGEAVAFFAEAIANTIWNISNNLGPRNSNKKSAKLLCGTINDLCDHFEDLGIDKAVGRATVKVKRGPHTGGNA